MSPENFINKGGFGMSKIGQVGLVMGFLAIFLGTIVLAQEHPTFQGIVFEDANQNGILDAGEKGISGVCVSNGLEVTKTDQEGRYVLPKREEMVVFVVKPAGYSFPVNEKNIPQFSYVHRPKGSPEFIREYAGFSPTGELPEMINFPLFPGKEEDNFKAIVIGDTQVTNHQEISYLRDSLVQDVQPTEALFALTIGDNVNDVLSLYDRYTRVMSYMGIPIFYTPGNHDMNYDSQNDTYSLETYTKKLTPPYYAFVYGKVHFIILDNVVWDGKAYHGEIPEEQLTWLNNYLTFVPQDDLLVIALHIPLISYQDRTAEKHQVKNREDLFALLEGRKVLFLAGHTHTLERFSPETEIDGWSPGLPFPQIIVGAACGSWWSGPRDEYGVPFSYQRDAAPKGYMIFEFQGTNWKEMYKVPGRSPEEQINISFYVSDRVNRRLKSPTFPDSVFFQEELFGIHVVANTFCNVETVEYSVDNVSPQSMTLKPIPDPIMDFYSKDLSDWMRTVGSTHTFIAPLPADLKPGVHSVTVIVKDRYGRRYQTKKIFEVI